MKKKIFYLEIFYFWILQFDSLIEIRSIFDQEISIRFSYRNLTFRFDQK